MTLVAVEPERTVIVPLAERRLNVPAISWPLAVSRAVIVSWGMRRDTGIGAGLETASPANTALGLSAFYIALLTLMCGFLAATVVNSVVASALGYATSEMGPRWRQRQPVPINRWQTLLIKWAIVVALTAVLTALVLVVAAGALGMDAPYPALLWLFMWLSAASVGVGTIV